MLFRSASANWGYTPPTGFVEPHIDAEPLMRLVISGYLTRRGKHYNKGGFYMIDENNKKLDLEDNIEDGDVGFFYATLRTTIIGGVN